MGVSVERVEPAVRVIAQPRRLVLVTRDMLIVEAIRIGFRGASEFRLVGRADARRTDAESLLRANPDVVLLDDMDQSESTLDLVQNLRDRSERLALIVLSLELEPPWLERAFAAGANGVMSKATHPVTLATLVRETLNGHVFHIHASMRSATVPGSPAQTDESPALTPRELEILRLVASGATNGDIARGLWVTEQTVKFHLRNLYRKLGIANRTQASRFAHLRGLADPPESVTSMKRALGSS